MILPALKPTLRHPSSGILIAGQEQARHAAAGIISVLQQQAAAVAFGDLPGEDEADAGAAGFGGEERDEQVVGGG